MKDEWGCSTTIESMFEYMNGVYKEKDSKLALQMVVRTAKGAGFKVVNVL